MCVCICVGGGVQGCQALLSATHVEQCCHNAHIDAVEHELSAKQGRQGTEPVKEQLSAAAEAVGSSSSTTILLLVQGRSGCGFRFHTAAPRASCTTQMLWDSTDNSNQEADCSTAGGLGRISCVTADHCLQTTNLRDAGVLCCSGCWSVRFTLAATRTTRLLVCALKGCCWPTRRAPALTVVQLCILAAALLLVD